MPHKQPADDSELPIRVALVALVLLIVLAGILVGVVVAVRL